LAEIDELQRNLSNTEMYIDIEQKAEEFQKKLVNVLTKAGFHVSPRAEGFAFFPGEEQGWKSLPSIRLTRAGNVLVLRIHATDMLTASNASAVSSSPADIYRRLIVGLEQARALFHEYKKKASYVSISPNPVEPALDT